MAAVKLILTDIEGTTSSIAFVKDVLFPYAEKHIDEFIRQHQQEAAVAEQIRAAKNLIEEQQKTSEISLETVIAQLKQWIKDDIKATPLKTLQGMLWKQGYEQGDYKAHVYPDAVEYLQKWHQQGIPLFVYSSGSVKAQHLFFKYSEFGDLLKLFSGHFDTNVGHKQDSQSYQNIFEQFSNQYADLNIENILFLSDVEAECDAAEVAGMKTALLKRSEDYPEFTQKDRTAFNSFEKIIFE